MSSSLGNDSEKIKLQLILPIVIPAFIDKLGNAGHSAVGPYLVKLNISEADSSLILGMGKCAAVLAPLALGLLSNRISFKALTICSLFLSALAFACLPLANHWITIMMCVFVTQLASAASRYSIRGSIFDILPSHLQMHGIGWLRIGNNLGSTAGTLIASFFAAGFISGIFYWDAFSSVIAAITMIFLLRKNKSNVSQAVLENNESNNQISNSESNGLNQSTEATTCAAKPQSKNAVLHVIIFSLFSLSWEIVYDLFDSGASARFERLHPNIGAAFFYKLMLLNTILCAFLTLKANKYLKKPSTSIMIGTLLTATGAALGISIDNRAVQMIGMSLWTLGEIGTLSILFLLGNTFSKRTSHPGFWFGFTAAALNLGKPIAGLLVFPYVVNSNAPYIVFGIFGIIALILGFIVNRIGKQNEIYA